MVIYRNHADQETRLDKRAVAIRAPHRDGGLAMLIGGERQPQVRAVQRWRHQARIRVAADSNIESVPAGDDVDVREHATQVNGLLLGVFRDVDCLDNSRDDRLVIYRNHADQETRLGKRARLIRAPHRDGGLAMLVGRKG